MRNIPFSLPLFKKTVILSAIVGGLFQQTAYAADLFSYPAAPATSYRAQRYYPSSYEGSNLCAQQTVLNRINKQFSHGMRHVFHLPNLHITQMTGIRTVAYEPALPYSGIKRTFCKATAILNDNSRHHAWYMIEDYGGFNGKTIQSCIEGLDLWRIYGGACKTLKR